MSLSLEMAITALPDATIHLLGSAQALTTPTSLVKELVDNALDAKATSIDILISPNTLDKIEVRDNGHGIPQQDLDALGRRGHTSKLRTFDELKSIGGISLGFRGEALASAVQLGLVSVTTRTEGEAVATSVQLKAPGGIANQNRTSHPVGTKVSVTKFLYNLPVRKQTAQKDSAKTMKKIKELLQSYAFARPRVRFCLKVASGGKGSWSFTPRPNDGMKEAASQIIGRDAAAQCIEKSLVFSDKSFQFDTLQACGGSKPTQVSDPIVSGSDRFIVEVFMPKPKATIIGHGQYISVDSRPVSHDKGTMRKLVSIFKYYAKGTVSKGEGKIKDPFLRLNIKCPVSSYDPNVEPAKDDVIFQSESLVLESIEQLFKDVYGEPSASSITATPETPGGDPDNFELLMSRNKGAGEPPSSSEQVNSVQLQENIGPKSPAQASMIVTDGPLNPPTDEANGDPERIEGRKWSVDMSKDFSEDVEGSQWAGQSSQISRQPQQDVADSPAGQPTPLNPWIISKLNAPIRPKNIPVSPTSAVAAPDSTALPLTEYYLPTPQISSDPVAADVDSLILTRTARPPHIINSDDIQTLALNRIPSSSHEPPKGSDDLPPATTVRRLSLAYSDDGLLLGDDSDIFSRRNDFNNAREVLEGPGQRSPPHSGSNKSKRVNKPFVPPMMTVDHAMPRDGLRQTTLTGGIIYPAPAEKDCTPASLDPDPNDELAWAMDFERRKEDATRQRRKEILAARAEAEADIAAPIVRRRRPQVQGEALELDAADAIVRSSPHKNRYNAAIANLEARKEASIGDDVAKPIFKTSLPDGDPRAYLMRRRKSMQPSVPGGPTRPMRAKSTRLPLERIPEAEMLHRLEMRWPVDMDAVQTAFEKTKVHDVYINRGIQTVGLSMTPAEAKLVASRIQAAVENWMEKYPGKAYTAEYAFDSLINVQ
ncbi:hypothetical protein IFR04_006706 [Cadophora malorum]|uniref:DNA mismatch repair protein S5 domain-containing protein n=1 Tax=Cadophora malorum TaxID=108018 RepID=A0A8H7TJW8_9HELO|nr:hypothetical protein IFR04_006706 [Cadophora malorum]